MKSRKSELEWRSELCRRGNGEKSVVVMLEVARTVNVDKEMREALMSL